MRFGISGTGLNELGALWNCAKQNPGTTINDRQYFIAFIGSNLLLNARETQAKVNADQKSENDSRSYPNLIVDEIESVNVASVFAV